MFQNIIFSSIAAAFALTASPSPEGAPEDRAPTHRKAKHNLCEKLECTADQKAEIKVLRTAMKAEAKPYREQAKALKAAIKTERSKDSPDPEVIESLRAEKKALRAEMKALKTAYMASVRALLTPEQAAELDELRERREARKGKRGKKGHGKKGHGKKGHGKKGKHAHNGDGPDAKGKRFAFGKKKNQDKGERKGERKAHRKGKRDDKANRKGKPGGKAHGKNFARAQSKKQRG